MVSDIKKMLHSGAHVDFTKHFREDGEIGICCRLVLHKDPPDRTQSLWFSGGSVSGNTTDWSTTDVDLRRPAYSVA